MEVYQELLYVFSSYDHVLLPVIGKGVWYTPTSLSLTVAGQQKMMINTSVRTLTLGGVF